MPGAAPSLSRRRVLVGAAALAALGATVSACGAAPEPPQPDPLEAQLGLAQRDSQMARNAAAAAGPFYGALLNVVADERAVHANALAKEIARAAGETTTSPTPVPAPSTASSPPLSRDDVIASLRESADSAANLAANLDGYRAGLLGSIAAACTTSVTVPLAMKEPAR